MNEANVNNPLRYGYSIVLACLLAVAFIGCSASSEIDYTRLFADPNNYQIQVDQFGRYRVQYPDRTYTQTRFTSETDAFIFVWKCCEYATFELEMRAEKRRHEALDREARWKTVEPNYTDDRES